VKFKGGDKIDQQLCTLPVSMLAASDPRRYLNKGKLMYV
jgi:hypothetical protein